MTTYELLPNGKVIIKRYMPSSKVTDEGTKKESTNKSNKADNQHE